MEFHEGDRQEESEALKWALEVVTLVGVGEFGVDYFVVDFVVWPEGAGM